MRFRQVWISKVYSDGRHNAFTGMARFGDYYYICFRNGLSHGDGPGTEDARLSHIFVVRSRADDLMTWEKVAAVRWPGHGDCRDSKIMVVGSAIHVYFHVTAFTADSAEGGEFVSVSRDGTTWTEPARLKGSLVKQEPGAWQWSYRKGPDAYYSIAHILIEEQNRRRVVLARSDDGLAWDLDKEASAGLMAAMPEDSSPNEVDLAFLPDRTVLAAIRTNGLESEIATSRPPYHKWSGQYVPVLNFGGPCIWPTRCGVLVSARQWGRGQQESQTMLWWLKDGHLMNALALPSAGDCSYPGMADGPNGEALVCYYSGHECPHRDSAHSSPSIYLARVEIEEDPVRC